MRKQSIFASTKVVAQATAQTVEELALLSTDLVRLGRQELQSTAKLNQLENTMEYSDERIQGLTALYTQLATVEALPDSTVKQMQIDTIKRAIATIEEV